MKHFIFIITVLVSCFSFSQDDKEKQKIITEKKANSYVYEGNSFMNNDNAVNAEMEYRKAISEQPSNIAGAYNLGYSYYKNGDFDEALYRNQQAAKNATSKEDKHKAFHNIGNILMQNKLCKEAVEAFKNALRNDPTDDETRYNFALAKECAKQQEEENKDKNKDKDKEDKDKDEKKKEDKKEDEKKDNKDKGDKDKKEGEDKEDDKGKPKDEKKDKGKGDDKEKEKPKPQPGKLSAQQVKNLLEAMNNKEQKVQEKMNAEKQKGVKIKTEKDW
jgi:Tfp pilus assembly protein PilF